MLDKVWMRILTSLSRSGREGSLEERTGYRRKGSGKADGVSATSARAFNVMKEARMSAASGCLMEMSFAFDRTCSPELQPGVLWQCR